MLLIIQQLLIGVAIGFTMQIVFAAVELAGKLIGLQMGLSFATFINADSDQVPIVGSFLAVRMMLVSLALNGHLMLIAGRELFSVGVTLALPVIAAMLLANLALGVLTRTAPQLNLFAIGFPGDPRNRVLRCCRSRYRFSPRDGTCRDARPRAVAALKFSLPQE